MSRFTCRTISGCRSRRAAASTCWTRTKRSVSKVVAGDANKLLLDMVGLSYISSAGLRIVLQAAKQMKTKGGRLALCSLKEQIKEVFDISGFSGILDISSTPEEAMLRLST
jgi:anti-anti-sigma factor